MNSGLNVLRSHFGFASFYKSPFNLNVNSPRSVREYHMPVCLWCFILTIGLYTRIKTCNKTAPDASGVL